MHGSQNVCSERERSACARLPTRLADACKCSCAVLLSLPAHAKHSLVAHPPMPAWGRERHCQGSCHHASVSQPVCPHTLPTVMLLSHALMHMLGEAQSTDTCLPHSPAVEPCPDVHSWRRHPRRGQPLTCSAHASQLPCLPGVLVSGPTYLHIPGGAVPGVADADPLRHHLLLFREGDADIAVVPRLPGYHCAIALPDNILILQMGAAVAAGSMDIRTWSLSDNLQSAWATSESLPSQLTTDSPMQV